MALCTQATCTVVTLTDPPDLKQKLKVWPQSEVSVFGVSTMVGRQGWGLPQNIGLISLTLIQSLNEPLAQVADFKGLDTSQGL